VGSQGKCQQDGKQYFSDKIISHDSGSPGYAIRMTDFRENRHTRTVPFTACRIHIDSPMHRGAVFNRNCGLCFHPAASALM
jgi:hypothetical protein